MLSLSPTIWASILIPLALILLPVLWYFLKPPHIPGIPNATPMLPLIGNAIFYGYDPTLYLQQQRKKHGDVFLVNLAIFKVVFFFGPEGTNAILKGTERSGISFWSALEFLMGVPVTRGLEAPGWVEASGRLMQKNFSDPINIDRWMSQICIPIVRKRFHEWSVSGEPVSLFRGMSQLVVTLLLNMFVGEEFAILYGDELVPLIRRYEPAFQKPQTKVLPHWMSKDGRLVDFAEERMVELIKLEARARLREPERYKNNGDYLQLVLNAEGGKYIDVYGYHILGLVMGAHTNQTTTFCWSLLHALRTPLLAALREAKSRDLLEATFRETGRLYTNLLNVRRLTSPQTILGKHIPSGTFIACSPLITARDPTLFPDPDSFKPERWLTQAHTFDEERVKSAQRTGASSQFGKGQHACVGEKMGRVMVMDIFWETVLGWGTGGGYDVEIVSGLKQDVGIDGVGVEAAWAEENFGTPFERGEPVMVRFKKRAATLEE